MLKWTTETGETRYLAVHALPAWGGGSQCDPADINACLKANPEACAEVLAGMGTTHFAARDAEWWHDRFVAEKARAEQAEHSLAASERALAALRYQAQAGGCELSTVGENSYHCRTDAPCGLCRLRHRAEQAERSLATVTAERDEARDRAERAEVQLAGCGSAALGYVDPPAKKGDYGWSASYGDVLALRAQLAKTEQVVDAAREDAQHCPHACSPPCPFDRAVARTRAALRALDSPVVAGTDSGGASGAATPEGGHAAPTGGPMPPPEPAGSSLEATRDLQAPATRAELEELRREVLETVADVCLRADDNAQAPWPWPLTRLGAELRRRVERLEGG